MFVESEGAVEQYHGGEGALAVWFRQLCDHGILPGTFDCDHLSRECGCHGNYYHQRSNDHLNRHYDPPPAHIHVSHEMERSCKGLARNPFNKGKNGGSPEE